MSRVLSRQRLELAYSFFLLIFIPAAIVGSTIWLTSQVKSNFDLELRRKANLANEVFGVSAANIISTSSAQEAAQQLQQLVGQTTAQAPEIDGLNVAVSKGDGFVTVASSDASIVGKVDDSIQTKLAWSKGQAVASLVSASEGADRDWLVATPVGATNGQPAAIATMRVSLHASDVLISDTLRRSFIILSIIVAVIILLLMNHFRFVQYAELFRKQKELDQMKDDFISIATHELKAPMSVIKGYISMSLEEDVSKQVREMLTIGLDQTDRLNRLVTDLLDVSRIEQNRTKYNLASIQLVDTIKPMLNVYEVKAQEKQLALSYQPPTDLPLVLADPDRVSEIFTNLIDNAIKYSRTGTVMVRHNIIPGFVTTVIADTGIGMTQEEMSKLFTRFYRAKNDDTKDIAGTGLGLWIIQQYAQKMGGSITVTSEKGKGSEFTVTLPIANKI